ncbi:DUF465 domain-containing protein [Rhodobacteraceae bacterium]|nr:DUF465 domain-containing protein [Paracoccaceae bacterium]
MSATPHALAEDFAADIDRLRELKSADPRFARLVAEYEKINDEVYRAESHTAPQSSFDENKLRKRRASLKDEIAEQLSA